MRRGAPRVLEDLIRDIGYGCRGLRRSPALVLTCVFSLGTGIGVNATIFTALRSELVLHQPLHRGCRTGASPGRIRAAIGEEPDPHRRIHQDHHATRRLDRQSFSRRLGHLPRVGLRPAKRAQALVARSGAPATPGPAAPCRYPSSRGTPLCASRRSGSSMWSVFFIPSHYAIHIWLVCQLPDRRSAQSAGTTSTGSEERSDTRTDRGALAVAVMAAAR